MSLDEESPASDEELQDIFERWSPWSPPGEEILRHYRRRRMAQLAHSIPPLLFDTTLCTPPDEKPDWYYIVIKNLPDGDRYIRDQILATCMRYGEVKQLTSVSTFAKTSVYVGFQTIEEAHNTAIHFPRHIGGADLWVGIPDSLYS